MQGICHSNSALSARSGEIPGTTVQVCKAAPCGEKGEGNTGGMAVKNMAASVLTRLKNQAKEERIPFQLVLQLFLQIRP